MRSDILYPAATAEVQPGEPIPFSVLLPGATKSFSPELIVEEESFLFFGTRGPLLPGIVDWAETYSQLDWSNNANLTRDVDSFDGLLGFEGMILDDLDSGVEVKPSLVRPGEVTVRVSVITSKDTTFESHGIYGSTDSEEDNFLWRFTNYITTPCRIEILVEENAGANKVATWTIPKPRRDKAYTYSFTRDDLGNSQMFMNGYKLNRIVSVSGGPVDDGEGNVSNMQATGGEAGDLKVSTHNLSGGVGFVAILPDESNQAAEVSFCESVGSEFSSREQELFLFDDFDSLLANVSAVAVFKPDGTAEGFTDLEGTVEPADYSSGGASQKLINDHYWFSNNNTFLNSVPELVLINDLVIEATVLYEAAGLICRMEASGETADTDYPFDLRIEGSGFAYFQETGGGPNVDIDFLHEENSPREPGEVIKVRLIREDLGDGTARMALEVLRNDDLTWRRLPVGSFSDATGLVAYEPSSRTIIVPLPTDSSSTRFRMSQGASPIRYIALFNQASVQPPSGVTFYSSYQEMKDAVGTSHQAGDLVGVSWTADSFVNEGFEYGEVQSDGSIYPDPLTSETGLPFKVMGFSYENKEGDLITENAEGYPEVDTTGLSQFSRTEIQNLYLYAFSDVRMFVRTDLAELTIPDDAVNYIFGQRTQQYGAGKGWVDTFVRKKSSAFYAGYLTDDGDTSDLSFDANDDYLEDREIETHHTVYSLSALPSFYSGGGGIAPIIDIVQRNDTFEHRHGYWDVDDRKPSSKIQLVANENSVAGDGTITWVRIKAEAEKFAVTYNSESYATVKAAYDDLPNLSPGTEVVVSWAADAYVDAGEVRGVVSEEGGIYPELWSHPEGIPIKALGVTISTYAGDGIPLVGGYPQIDNTTIAAATEMRFEGDFFGLTQMDLWVDLQVPVLTDTGGSSSLCGMNLRSLQTGTPASMAVFLVVQTSVREGYNRDGSFGTNVVSADLTYADDRLIKLTYETTNRNTAPAFVAGFDSVNPDVDNAQVSATWVSANGNWNVNNGPEIYPNFYVNPGASVGNGTLTFTRVRFVGNSITL